MKIHKLSIVGGVLGIGIIVCSIIQWFFLWYDPSQLVIGMAIGIIICIFAYIYNWMKQQDEEFKKLNKRIDAFTEWWTKKEME